MGDHFPITIYQSGNGVLGNINANEVIAKRAEEILNWKKTVRPNEDVNMNQSGTECFAMAMHIATLFAIEKNLKPSLKLFQDSLMKKADEFAHIVKVSRINLQDSYPITLGDEFACYSSQIEDNFSELQILVPKLLEISQCRMMISREFMRDFISELSQQTGYSFKPARNQMASIACHDPLIRVSGSFNNIATSLMKISNDIRFLGSGPKCGLSELILPENEPGSSIMPGKVNPTQCEALAMVCAQVIGNHVTVTVGGSRGNFELNAFKPLIIGNVLNSSKLISNAVDSFRKNCVEGIEVNKEHIESQLNKSVRSMSDFLDQMKCDENRITNEKVELLAFEQAKIEFSYVMNDQFGIFANHNRHYP